MPRALVIKHHAEDNPGLVGEALIQRGYVLTVALLDATSATPRLDGHDVLVILGSTHAVYDREVEAAWFGRELGVIGDADRRGVPILGICFGAQALCQYAGGSVRRGTHPEIGWYRVDATEDSPIEPGPWFEYHFDECSLPSSAHVWARNEQCVQAFAVGRHLGVQFHPELDAAQLRDWFSVGADDARSLGLNPEALIAQTVHEEPAARERAARLVNAFLAHASDFESRRTGVGDAQ